MHRQMTVEKAIKTAIDFERRNYDLFQEAASKAVLSHVRDFFQQLADDEESHVQYLHMKLKEWTTSGEVTLSKLASIFPSKDKIDKSINTSSRELFSNDFQNLPKDIPLLKKVLFVEQEAIRLYQEMIEKLPDYEISLFDPILKIEEAHVELVQSEIDFIEGD